MMFIRGRERAVKTSPANPGASKFHNDKRVRHGNYLDRIATDRPFIIAMNSSVGDQWPLVASGSDIAYRASRSTRGSNAGIKISAIRSIARTP